MEILTVILIIYLAIGTIFALYLLFTGKSSVFALPINIIGGPISLVVFFKRIFKKERV